MGYEDIKRLASDLRCRVEDLPGLTRTTDPFYAGQPSHVEAANWFGHVHETLGFRHGSHLRRIHYALVSTVGITKPNGEPYLNTDQDWKFLVRASLDARYLGIIPGDL